jgi:uncharacterized protein with HEPN domain
LLRPDAARIWKNPQLAFALTRAIEIFGGRFAGGARHPAIADADSLVPIIGMRNRVVHAYFEINLNVIWKTATEEIPKLLPSSTPP